MNEKDQQPSQATRLTLKNEPFRIQIWPNPVLTKSTIPVTEFDDDLKTLTFSMRIKMQKLNGIGLAAPQIGNNKSIIVVNADDFVEELINPEITHYSEDKSWDIEQCLSFPGVHVRVERPNKITVQYQDTNGEFMSKELEGLAARCVQHEVDHLKGITLLDYVDGRMKKDVITRKMKKLKKRIKRYEQNVSTHFESANK